MSEKWPKSQELLGYVRITELSNLGEMPIEIIPGLMICQLFIQEAKATAEYIDYSSFIGLRRPTVGRIILDDIARKLSASST